MTLPDEFVELAARVSNWGRWGDGDEIGTLNLIDGDAVRRGAAAVQHRQAVLARRAARPAQSRRSARSRDGSIRCMRWWRSIREYQGSPDGFCTSDDIVTMGLQAATHWDALSHVSYGGKLYNGFPASSITSEAGATTLWHLANRDARVAWRPSRCRPRAGARAARGRLRHHPRRPRRGRSPSPAMPRLQPGDVVLVRTGQHAAVQGT